MRKIDKLTADDWRRYGAQVKTIDRLLGTFYCDTCRKLGKSHPLAKKAEKNYKDFTHIKCKLDDLVCAQDDRTGRSLLGDEAISVFYGEYTDRQKELMEEDNN